MFWFWFSKVSEFSSVLNSTWIALYNFPHASCHLSLQPDESILVAISLVLIVHIELISHRNIRFTKQTLFSPEYKLAVRWWSSSVRWCDGRLHVCSLFRGHDDRYLALFLCSCGSGWTERIGGSIEPLIRGLGTRQMVWRYNESVRAVSIMVWLRGWFCRSDRFECVVFMAVLLFEVCFLKFWMWRKALIHLSHVDYKLIVSVEALNIGDLSIQGIVDFLWIFFGWEYDGIIGKHDGVANGYCKSLKNSRSNTGPGMACSC